MAKIVEFYIPQSFRKVSKWFPPAERGKVLAFRLNEPQLTAVESTQIAHEAREYFELAHAYTAPRAEPLLIVIMGLPASGKTTPFKMSWTTLT